VGLPAGPAIQRPGLTGAGHHRADEPTDQRPRGSHVLRPPLMEDPHLPRPRSPSCSTQPRRFPLGMSLLAVVYASHHPHQRRSRGTSTGVQGRLQENTGTTLPGHVHRRSRETPGKHWHHPPGQGFSPAVT
jgi:hypothetical protein